MSELNQKIADQLLKMEKYKTSEEVIRFPISNAKIVISLVSSDSKEEFQLDVNRLGINLQKITYQKRARKVYSLARIDFGGGPHLNPDGEKIACPHLHIYKEGHGTKWAVPLPKEHFSDPSNLQITLEEFLRYCNVVDLLIIQYDLNV